MVSRRGRRSRPGDGPGGVGLSHAAHLLDRLGDLLNDAVDEGLDLILGGLSKHSHHFWFAVSCSCCRGDGTRWLRAARKTGNFGRKKLKEFENWGSRRASGIDVLLSVACRPEPELCPLSHKVTG